MQTLMEISSELDRLNMLLDDSDGEITDEVSAEIDKALGDLHGKADSYVAIVRELELRADAREHEAERLGKLIAADRNTAKALRSRLKDAMEFTGQRKIETTRFRLSVCKNGGKAPVDVHEPPEQIPPAYQRVTVAADIDAIRDELERGTELSFAVLVARSTHLRIT